MSFLPRRLSPLTLLLLFAAAQLALVNDARASGCELFAAGQQPAPPRILSYRSREHSCLGGPCFGLVLDSRDGVPLLVYNLSADGLEGVATLESFHAADGFGRAADVWAGWLGEGRDAIDAEFIEELNPQSLQTVVEPVVNISVADLLHERVVVLGAGLNYAAHAQEAGGGEMFLFAKPVVPTSAYSDMAHPGRDALLDYEVELGFVLLEELDLGKIPAAGLLEKQLAWFTASDMTDRAPLVLHGRRGAGDAKAGPGFLVVGPWMVHGAELPLWPGNGEPHGLHMFTQVTEEGGVRCAQSSDTGLMKNPPAAILRALSRRVARDGHLAIAPATLGGERRKFQLAVPARRQGWNTYVLPAGSVVLTGTPAGVAFQAPGLVRRVGYLFGALATWTWPVRRAALGSMLRRRDELDYLAVGDRVEVGLELLGRQSFRITPAR